jgi:hypothetical protein
MTILIYFVLMLFGALFWIGAAFHSEKYGKYWVMFTLLWPVGLIVLTLYGLKQAFDLVEDIFSS